MTFQLIIFDPSDKYEYRLLSVLSFYVNVADSAFEYADLCSVAAGLKNESFFLYADDLSDDTADGRDLIADLKIVAHIVLFLLLLLLRPYHKEIHCHEHNKDHADRKK